MLDLVATAEELQFFCEKQDWKFCFIGGFALLFWGEQRLTKDVDLTLLTNFTDDRIFVETLLGKYQARISDAAEFALSRRVLFLKTAGGVGIDISFDS